MFVTARDFAIFQMLDRYLMQSEISLRCNILCIFKVSKCCTVAEACAEGRVGHWPPAHTRVGVKIDPTTVFSLSALFTVKPLKNYRFGLGCTPWGGVKILLAVLAHQHRAYNSDGGLQIALFEGSKYLGHDCPKFMFNQHSF